MPCHRGCIPQKQANESLRSGLCRPYRRDNIRFCSAVGRPMTVKRVGRTISAIGRAAGVVVNKPEGKAGSAHHLRRAFGTRWAARIKPATLQLLMRHRIIETTLRYYVSQDADDVAEVLWQASRPMSQAVLQASNWGFALDVRSTRRESAVQSTHGNRMALNPALHASQPCKSR